MTEQIGEQTHQEAVAFVLEMAGALQRYGIPSHRLEEFMDMLNASLQVKGQFFAAPGTLMASFDEGGEHRSYILRIGGDDLNLEKLDALMALNLQVVSGQMSPARASREVKAIVAAPDRYGPLLTIFCFMISSGGAARLFGGGWREVSVASTIGLGLGLLLVSAGTFRRLGKIVVPLAAIGATLLANLAVFLVNPYSVHIATVTGLIVLIPGLSLTTAMTELATGHPISGTARLANAMTLFLMLGFGIALGGEAAQLLPLTQITAPPLPLPDWTQWLALAAVPLGFQVLFKARPSDLGWVFMAGVGSFGAARLGSSILGPELGGFLAAFLLGIFSNLFAWFSRRPAAIVLVPGIMLLVPGSMGFRSLSSLLQRETLIGIETAFAMSLAAISLVAGLIFANVLFARKHPI